MKKIYIFNKSLSYSYAEDIVYFPRLIFKTDDGTIIENRLEDLDIIDDRDGSIITEITISKERKY